MQEVTASAKAVVIAELSNGQMADDVAFASQCDRDVVRCNWFGGVVPSEDEVASRAAEACRG